MSLQRLKLVTFDATNTLLKFRVPPWQYYTIIARDHGFRGTEDEVKTKLKDNFKVMWEKHPNYGKTSIYWESWWSQVVKMTLKDHMPANADLDGIACRLIDEFKTSKCWCVADGGERILNRLRKLNISVGVISNFDPRLIDILQNIGLYDKFDFIITSYDIGYSKPDKRIFKCAMEKCKQAVQPSEALHVGDDLEKDYEGARAAGWHAVLINPNLKIETPPACKHVFDSLEDLCVSVESEKLVL